MSAFRAAVKASITQKDESSIQQTISADRTGPISGRTGIECPFDLNQIFQSDIDRFQKLKDVLKFIFENLDKLYLKTTDVETKMVSKFMQIEKFKVLGEANKEEIDKILKVQKILEDKSNDAEEGVQELKCDTETLKMNLFMIKNNSKENKEQISELKSLIDSLGQNQNSSIDISKKNQDGNFDANQLRSLFPSLESFKNLENRLQSLENQDQQKTKQISDLQKKQNTLEDQFAALQGKMNASFEQISQTINISSQQNSNQNTGISSADLAQIKSQIQTINSQLLQKVSKNELEDFGIKQNKHITKEVDKLEKQIEFLRQNVADNQSKVAGLQKEFDEFKQMFDMLQKSFQNLQKQFQQNSQQQRVPAQNTEHDNTFRLIFEKLDFLERDIIGFKDEFSRWVKEFQDNLNLKADIETVKALEQSLLDRLNEIVKALSKQFADKQDTKKALKLLEKNLKHMYDLFMSKGNNENEDDAMFTKKPLGGTSCASCAKDVIDMYGKRVEYLPWGKLPFRDPSERIARVGQGFSKMLSMINPDHMSKFDVQKMKTGSQEGLQNNYNENQIHQDGSKNFMRANMPITANQTQNNFNPQGFKQQQGNDPNRPSSAKIQKNRPFTRGTSKSRRAYNN